MEQITSSRNDRVKEWASLKQKKFRDQTGLFFIEGIRLVEEALSSGALIKTVLVLSDLIPTGRLDQVLNLSNSLNIEIIEVNQIVIDHIADTKSPQGVIAIGKQFAHDLTGLMEKKINPCYLVADNIQDPGNLGTMIRSADAVGATGVFVLKGSVDIYNPKMIRSTMGSIFHLPVIEIALSELLAMLRKHNIILIGTSADAEMDHFSCDYTGGIAIVIGSEAQGISGEIRQEINKWVSLPMPGNAESLNAAIASSVILYEALRQRSGK